MNKAVIALGSNIEPEVHIPAALKALSKTFNVLTKSDFVYTKAVEYTPQADFLNGAVLIETPRNEPEIVAALKKIESRLGRQRTANKSGPRKIDLDLVVFNGQITDKDVLERDFLQHSIREVLPEFRFPDPP